MCASCVLPSVISLTECSVCVYLICMNLARKVIKLYEPTHPSNHRTFVIYEWSLLSMALNGIGSLLSQLFWALALFCMMKKYRKIGNNAIVFVSCFVLIFIVIFLVVKNVTKAKLIAHCTVLFVKRMVT